MYDVDKKNEKDQNSFIDYNMEFWPKGPDAISPDKFPIITEQSKYSICQIEKNGGKGTGVLCKIPFPDSLNLLTVIITCNHVLNEKDIKQENRIKLLFNNGEITKYLPLDNDRKIYTNDSKNVDLTIIEIKKDDGFNTNVFLDVDNFLYKGDDLNAIYKKLKNIYLIHYPQGPDYKISFGAIKSISVDNYGIEHFSDTDNGSSGCPIINISNCRIIGIHKGSHKKYDYKLGTALKEPIKEFNMNKNMIDKNINKKQLNNFIKQDDDFCINNIQKKLIEITQTFKNYAVTFIKDTDFIENQSIGYFLKDIANIKESI